MKTRQNMDLPEYVSGSIGKPDFNSIANRVREMADLLSAHGCEDAASHLVQAYGTLLGRIATTNLSLRVSKSA